MSEQCSKCGAGAPALQRRDGKPMCPFCIARDEDERRRERQEKAHGEVVVSMVTIEGISTSVITVDVTAGSLAERGNAITLRSGAPVMVFALRYEGDPWFSFMPFIGKFRDQRLPLPQFCGRARADDFTSRSPMSERDGWVPTGWGSYGDPYYLILDLHPYPGTLPSSRFKLHMLYNTLAEGCP